MADNIGYVHECGPELKNEDNNQHCEEIDRTPHELFIEMDELILSPTSGCFEWIQQSRWLKYEEAREEGSERWGENTEKHDTLQK